MQMIPLVQQQIMAAELPRPAGGQGDAPETNGDAFARTMQSDAAKPSTEREATAAEAELPGEDIEADGTEETLPIDPGSEGGLPAAISMVLPAPSDATTVEPPADGAAIAQGTSIPPADTADRIEAPGVEADHLPAGLSPIQNALLLGLASTEVATDDEGAPPQAIASQTPAEWVQAVAPSPEAPPSLPTSAPLPLPQAEDGSSAPLAPVEHRAVARHFYPGDTSAPSSPDIADPVAGQLAESSDGSTDSSNTASENTAADGGASDPAPDQTPSAPASGGSSTAVPGAVPEAFARILAGQIVAGLSSAAPAASGSLPSALTTPADRLAAELRITGTDGGTFEVSLPDAEIGQVRMEMTRTGESLRIVVAAERADTLDMLRRNAETLVADLRQAGMGEASLSFGSWQQGAHDPKNGAPTLAVTDGLSPRNEDAAAPRMTAPPAWATASGPGRLHIRI